MNEQRALRKMVAPGMKRPGIWRNGVMQISIIRSCDKACFGCTQGSNLRGKPMAMTPDQFKTAVDSLEGYFGVVGIFGGNPCQVGGTLVYTTTGIRAIEDLEDKPFSVRNIRGEVQPAICWHAGKQPVFEIKLRGGHSYFATANHEWPAMLLEYGPNSKNKNYPNYCPKLQERSLGKIKTTDLKPGMRLRISSNDSLGFGSEGDAEDGFLAGWILGDGWVVQPEERGRGVGALVKSGVRKGSLTQAICLRGVGMIVSKADNASGIAARLRAKIATLGSAAAFREVKSNFEINIRHKSVDAWMYRFGVIGKSEGLPTTTWTDASEEFRKGLIDGLFSSDGHVEVSRERKYTRIRLTSAHEKLVRDVSAILGFYGIKTQLTRRERKGSFPNRKDYGKTYISWDLSISNAASVERFAKLFPLSHQAKNQRLIDAIGQHKTNDIESNNVEILSVEPTDRVEDVWDISVGDDTHTFQLAHCVTGNCVHPHFAEICEILRDSWVPFEQRGIWCNHPKGKGAIMRETFNPAVSNLNLHLDQSAYEEFARDWPECEKVLKGHDTDSRHSPVYVAMKDVIDDESKRWDLISKCDINRHWSAYIGTFRGELRAWFCEIAGAMSRIHQEDPNYPDTGIPVTPGWWKKPMTEFAHQVRKHCHDCGIPLRGYGSLAVNGEFEQVSKTHVDVYLPKIKGREVQLVGSIGEIDAHKLNKATDYIENSGV